MPWLLDYCNCYHTSRSAIDHAAQTGKTMPMPEVLAIIVNWNKRAALDRLLGSLPLAGATPFDVVVVDNASTDDSVAFVRENYPSVAIVENAENLGGTGGFNSGLRYGLLHPNNYRYFWLLDNDVIAQRNCLDALMQAINTDPKIGLVGSTVTASSSLVQLATASTDVGACSHDVLCEQHRRWASVMLDRRRPCTDRLTPSL